MYNNVSSGSWLAYIIRKIVNFYEQHQVVMDESRIRNEKSEFSKIENRDFLTDLWHRF